MIEARDLRLGNLFYLNDNALIKNQHYEGIAIHKIKGEDIQMCEIDIEAFNMSYKPIPITEEWLLILGFTPFYINGKLTHYRINSYFIRYDGQDFYFELGKGMIINVIFAHQLQNLYFVLTQKELKIQ